MRASTHFAVLLALIGGQTAFATEQDSCALSTSYRDEGAASYARGDLPGAVERLHRAIRACPSEPFYKFMLANALYRLGDLEGSSQLYLDFLMARPGHVEARMSLGFVLFELGQNTQALEQWTSAVLIEPESAFARAALAAGLLAAGNQSAAVLQYEHAMRLDHRYGNTDALTLDIRWKPEMLKLLDRLGVVGREEGQ